MALNFRGTFRLIKEAGLVDKLVSEFGIPEIVAIQRVVLRTADKRVTKRELPDDYRRSLATVGGHMRRTKRFFTWGSSKGLVPPDVVTRIKLADVTMKPTDERIRPPKRRQPVPTRDVVAVKAHLTRPLWDCVQVLWETGARAEEILGLRVCDIERRGIIDRAGAHVWTARLDRHKTAHHGQTRILKFAGRERRIIERLMREKSASDYLFDPRDEDSANAARFKRDRYAPDTLTRRVAAACRKAGVPVWTPHQLRHAAFTRITLLTGSEATAGAVCGHAHGSRIAQIYNHSAEELAERFFLARVGVVLDRGESRYRLVV